MTRRSALSLGELSLALVVGVGAYQDRRFQPLPAAAAQAKELAAVLVDPAASQIPPDNVVALTDPDATRTAVLAALSSLTARVGADHTVCIYFAGHALDLGDGFGLLLCDSSADDPAGSALTSHDLERALATSAARGILLILDCCGGAALAEKAPGLFRSVGRASEYRILLSAARAGQPSWEGADGSPFTRALIDALAGRVSLSTQSGALYFSDLYTYLHDRVAPADAAVVRQEPIAAASIVRDPLLFVNARLTLAQVRLRVQRYSREQMRVLVRGWLAATTAVLVLGVAGVWAYIAGHHYLAFENDTITLYQGMPQWTGFGYPRRLWEYGIGYEEIAAASPLARGLPVVSRWGQGFRVAAFDQLTPLGQARWHYNAGAPAAARRIVEPLLAGRSNHMVWQRAALLYAAVAETAHVPRLVELAAVGQNDVNTAVLGRLFALAPEQGLTVARGLGYGVGTRGLHMQLLADIDRPCDLALAAYINEFAREPANTQFLRLSIDAALRSGCRLGDEALASDLQPAYLSDLARYLDLADADRAARFHARFVADLQTALRGEALLLLESDASAYLQAAKPGADCMAVESFAALLGNDAKIAAARALLRQCPGASARLTRIQQLHGAGFRYRVLGAGNPPRELLVLDLDTHGSTTQLKPALDSLAGSTLQASLPAVRAAATSTYDAAVRRSAVRLLRAADDPAPADLSSFERSGDHDLQNDAYLWLARHRRDAALAAVLGRLGDPTADFVVRTLAQLQLTAAERRGVVEAARANTVSAPRRGQLLAMFGNLDEVAAELAQTQVVRRRWAVSGLGFRDDLGTLAARWPAPFAPGGVTVQQLQRLAAQRRGLERELAGLSAEYANWRTTLMLELRQLNNEGLYLWLQSRCAECD